MGVKFDDIYEPISQQIQNEHEYFRSKQTEKSRVETTHQVV